MRIPTLAALRLPVLAGFLLLVASQSAGAQMNVIAGLQPVAQANRIPVQPDFTPQLQLTGHLPAWVRASHQVASRSADLAALLHVTVLLRRDPAVQAAFEQLLAAQQDRTSPLYHQWLTPAQIGEMYGPTPADVAAVSRWLTAQGFHIDAISPSRMMLDVSGSTAAVAVAFRTSFAYYDLAGTPRLSASIEPTIPAALSPVIDSIHGLTEVPLEPQVHSGRQPVPQSIPGTPTPQVTTTMGEHFLSPGDFDIIYDLNSVHATNTGATIGSAAQRIAIIGRSRVAASDISTFETKTGLPSITPNVVIPTTGSDPGATHDGNQQEATLDVDRVIGTAYGAIPDLVVSASSSTYDGIYIAASYNVNTLKDPIMTISFGACEANAGINGVNLWNTLFSTAAGEGMSVFVSSDDSGAAGCDTSFATAPVSQVASINYICSSTYATCVGGTEFNDTANPSAYWSATNGSGLVSVLQYIPEGAWNEPITTNSSGTTVYQVSASGGGASQYIGKPVWQTGTGVPNDGHRDVPDVALSASAHDGYYACLAYAGADCTNYFEYFGGTSAAAPGMAGIAALINTRLGAAQGNFNPLLYQLAANYPSAFHDATIASSGVSGCTTATPSMCNNSTPGPSGLAGGLAGFTLTTGYDEATGLGSVDVANLISAAVSSSVPTFSLTPASQTLAFTSGATTSNTDAITLTSINGFMGTLMVTCTISTGTAYYQPTCSPGTGTASVAPGVMGTVTVTISSITAVSAGHTGTAQAGFGTMGRWRFRLAALLVVLLGLLPLRRRHAGLSPLALLLLVAGIMPFAGCGKGGSTSAAPVTRSSAGTYTVTVSGSGTTLGGSTPAKSSTTFTVTIQ